MVAMVTHHEAPTHVVWFADPVVVTAVLTEAEEECVDRHLHTRGRGIHVLRESVYMGV